MVAKNGQAVRTVQGKGEPSYHNKICRNALKQFIQKSIKFNNFNNFK